ncbi:hypothetical protein Pmani_015889 [Petrolisthes manimaculis]|uniref:Strictosidine synthase conserved region domain-containing protein n=1 Tax=Petrolisthes manimaculis TaxID=1843537 RepID=A0AAE1PSW2_9EUCA|nr:hypothetical protein Pmani_015889 [Petrolisthes manimaculis]
MSSLGWLLRKIYRVTKGVIIILLLLTFLPGIPPHVNFTTLDPLEPPLALEGALARNNILDRVERVLEGQIVGPESIASRRPQEIFVSLHGGNILRIWGRDYDNFKIIASIGPDCDIQGGGVCGRPLGLRFAPDGRLLVADCYLGIFVLNVDTGENESLFDISKEIEGEVALLTDDLDVDSDGYIYWSDASANANLDKALIELFASPSGRLLRFDPKTQTNKVLVSNLHFANGVQLTHDQQSVLVCETFKNRVLRHWLHGAKAGQTEVFVDRLPGSPDNIRSNGNDGYYIAIVTVFPDSLREVGNTAGRFPLLRKLATRILYLTRIGLETLAELISSYSIDQAAKKIFNFVPLGEYNLGHNNLSLVVEVDGQGQVIRSLQGHSGQQVQISEAQQVGDYLFLGSPFNNYLGKLYVGDKQQQQQQQQMKEGMKQQQEQQQQTKEGMKQQQQQQQQQMKEGMKQQQQQVKEGRQQQTKEGMKQQQQQQQHQQRGKDEL